MLPDGLASPPYIDRGRDLRLDLLRGAAVVGMVIDHVGGSRSWLYLLTGGDRFYVSAAEAFVFLSGIVTGIVYGGIAVRQGAGTATLRLLRRAGVLFVWATALTLAEPFAANALGLGWEDPLKRESLLEYVVSVATMHQTYHLTDVLLLYVLLFGVAGFFLTFMTDGKTKAALITSWSLWALWQTSTDYPAPWDIQGLTVFQFAAWQALFATGLAMGIHRDALAARFSRGSPRAWLMIGGLGLGVAIAAYQLRAVNRTLGATGASHLLSKADLGAGRLVVFAFGCLFAFALVTLAWQRFQVSLGWLLIPLGQHSLSAYILHVPAVMLVAELGLITLGPGSGSAEQNALLESIGVLMVWGVIVLHSRWADIRGQGLPALGRAAAGAWLDTCSPSRRYQAMILPEPSSRSI